MEAVFIEGTITADELLATVPSAIVLFLLKFTRTRRFQVNLHAPLSKDNCVVRLTKGSALENLEYTINEVLPDALNLCFLPALVANDGRRVVSGLCSVLRRIGQLCTHDEVTKEKLDIMGFKGGSLQACAEVSVWTKFCEVEIPTLVEVVLQRHKATRLCIPVELLKFDNQFKQAPRIRNVNKKKQDFRKKKKTTKPQMEDTQQMQKDVGMNGEEACELCLDNLTISGQIGKDSELPTELRHNFAEGTDLTLADLILYPCLSCILNHWKAHLPELAKHLPNVTKWYKRLTTIDPIARAARACGIPCAALDVPTEGSLPAESVSLPEVDSSDMFIRDNAKKKFKVSPAEVSSLLNKLLGIPGRLTVPDLSSRSASDVQLPWERYPAAVHPTDGDLPPERLERKKEQLENLATAVQSIANDGDTIVDFCAGGGHLGILIAYLLPQCQVILVENKEQSVDRAESRIDKLKLSNITIYQTNLDYFKGAFSIGTCLHACGVATDLVQQKCLQRSAAFVICPCCYGAIRTTHTATYPRSSMFCNTDITYEEYLMLGHGADQTEVSLPIAVQGKQCMVLIDSDRAALAMEHGYSVTLCTLQPSSCSPKNSLLIGTVQSAG